MKFNYVFNSNSEACILNSPKAHKATTAGLDLRSLIVNEVGTGEKNIGKVEPKQQPQQQCEGKTKQE